MARKSGGIVFYSCYKKYLQGIAHGAEFVNDGPIVVHDIERSDDPDYTYMLYLEDTDEDASDLRKEYDTGILKSNNEGF